MPGIEPQRADVIAAGAAIFAQILQRIDAPGADHLRPAASAGGSPTRAMSTGGPTGAS